MNPQLLLIDRLESSYQQLQKLLLEIEEFKYKLIWSQDLTSVSGQLQSYDACLVAYEIVEKELVRLVDRLATKALIVLTNDDESGQKALEAGAADYLNIKTITLSELRRSLRLTNKIARYAQKENHSISQTLFEQAAAGIFVLDVSPQRQLTFIAANRTYQNLASRFGKIKLGSSPHAELDQPIADKLVQYCHICLDSAQAVVYEQQIDATQQIWQISITPILSQGKIQQLQGIVVNVTSLKDQITVQNRYYNLLQTLTLKIAQSETIDQILTTVTVGIQSILKTDRVTMFQYLVDGSASAIADTVNPSYPSMLNLQFDDYLYYPQLHNKAKEHYSYVCNNVEIVDFPPYCLEFLAQFQIKSYSIVPIYLKSRSDHNENSTLWGLIGVQQCSRVRTWTTEEIVFLHQIAEQISIALDRTRLSQLEAAQKQELANSNTRLEEFAYSICHDLQSPLQIIANYAQLLQHCYQDQLEPRANRYIDYMYHESMRMQQQISDLLTYARIGHNQEAFSQSDFNGIVERAIANLRPLLQNKPGMITVVNRLPTIEVYEDLILLLFQNLICNGIKYNQQAQPQVAIDAQPQTNSWLFSVSDNGIGIEPQYYERIFQIFQRLHSDREYEGTGIGLAICKRIVELHHGTIWIESQLDQGTTVYFTLPAKIDRRSF